MATAICGTPQMGREPVLRRVEEAFADRDPLASGFRQFNADLRQPAGFSDLYQVEGRELFVRRSGAVWAVFPRGRYVTHEGKTIPQVPPGTTFSIGMPSSLRQEEPASALGQAAQLGLRPAGGAEGAGGASGPASGSGPAAPRLERRLDHARVVMTSLALPSPRLELQNHGLLAPRSREVAEADPRASAVEPGDSPYSMSGDPPPLFVRSESYRRERLTLLLGRLEGPEDDSEPRPRPASILDP